MQDYDNDYRVTARAQTCKRFIPGRPRNNRFSNEDGELSCDICRYWDGSNCLTDSYDSVFDSFEG
ncbi:MAG TPA: hypothetical protein GXX36_11490 [Clostridiaceae bacterium]|nr:hypothetical protein [Clostridiaceae bacterium]